MVYLRVSTADAKSVHLLGAKSKVAPIKQVSLPRLKLCAAALLTSLMHHTCTTLNLISAPIYLWSDSRVTLHWIQGHASRWKTYVANRVSLIQLLPEAHWRHVPGQDNPADCASRGVSPGELIHHPLWWTSPAWLLKNENCWPSKDLEAPIDEMPEARAATFNTAVKILMEPEILLRFSSLHRLLRVTAWCRRWHWSTFCNSRPCHTTLQLDELEDAMRLWIRLVQQHHYAAEIADITARRIVSPRSSFVKLSPVLDENNVLRVGGRLKHAILSQDERHPMILPPTSWFTKLLVESYHRRTLHGGVQLTLGLLRQRFWIPQGRAVVKRLLHRCITCTRWRAIVPQPQMGNLPREQVSSGRPFLHTGVD